MDAATLEFPSYSEVLSRPVAHATSRSVSRILVYRCHGRLTGKVSLWDFVLAAMRLPACDVLCQEGLASDGSLALATLS
jgi:hypothetical protein